MDTFVFLIYFSYFINWLGQKKKSTFPKTYRLWLKLQPLTQSSRLTSDLQLQHQQHGAS